MIRKSGCRFSDQNHATLNKTRSGVNDDGQGRKDDQGRADRQRDPPPSLAACDADRLETQQDRPRHRTAGHACDSRHDRQGSTPRPRRRREVRSEHDPEKWEPVFGRDHAPGIRKLTMKLSDIADNAGSRKKRMRVGRGIGSGKGKTAGRGGKGQTARSGVRIKGFEGGQMPLHRRLPKRGFNNIFRLDFAEIKLDRLEGAIGDELINDKHNITAESLIEAGVVARARDGVKLLGKGELKAKADFEVYGASKSALDAIEKLGGSVKSLAPQAAEVAAAPSA